MGSLTSILATVFFFLLYFWYFARFPLEPVPEPTTVPRPPSTVLRRGSDAAEQPFSAAAAPFFRLDASSDGETPSFAFTVDGIPLWTELLPRDHVVRGGKIVGTDACHEMPDGRKILATGRELYKRLMGDIEPPPPPSGVSYFFERDAGRVYQNADVFYYTCAGGKIAGVDECPPGHSFRGGECRPVDACAGRPPGILLADRFDSNAYYACRPSAHVAVRHTCADGGLFLHDSCRSREEVALYCRHHPDVMGWRMAAAASPALPSDARTLRGDDRTLLRCGVDGASYVETCPSGTRLFPSAAAAPPSWVCESDACVGRPDGWRVPLPPIREGPLTFSPGYRECVGGRVPRHEPVHCPSSWDPYLSPSGGENLTHLPLVFRGSDDDGGGRCVVPTLCTDVLPIDEATIAVPAYDFGKHVREWNRSDDVDRTVAFRCAGRTKIRTAVRPGYRVGLDFREEDACAGGGSAAFLSDRRDAYFDCARRTAMTCPPTENFFDGSECRAPIAGAHSYGGIGFFRYSHLSHDGWIAPLDYAPATPTAAGDASTTCQAPESIFLGTYDVCSHPDCQMYPFLSQVRFSIAVRDDGGEWSECVADAARTKIVKRPFRSDDDDVPDAKRPHFDFWTQRRLPPPPSTTYRRRGVTAVPTPTPCVPGQKLATGLFQKDASVFATCDASKQPFVFCPSADTAGIQQFKKWYACVPRGDRLVGHVPPGRDLFYYANELENVVPTGGGGDGGGGVTTGEKYTVSVDKGPEVPVPVRGIDIHGKGYLKVNRRMQANYKNRMTYPPNVAFNRHRGTRVMHHADRAYLIKNESFTRMRTNLPAHVVEEHLAEFQEADARENDPLDVVPSVVASDAAPPVTANVMAVAATAS